MGFTYAPGASKSAILSDRLGVFSTQAAQYWPTASTGATLDSCIRRLRDRFCLDDMQHIQAFQPKAVYQAEPCNTLYTSRRLEYRAETRGRVLGISTCAASGHCLVSHHQGTACMANGFLLIKERSGRGRRRGRCAEAWSPLQVRRPCHAHRST